MSYDEEPEDSMEPLMRAYAEGRRDQLEEDYEVVAKLLAECDDADAVSDNRLNTTRIREMLEHFKPGQCFSDACPTPSACDAAGCRMEKP